MVSKQDIMRWVALFYLIWSNLNVETSFGQNVSIDMTTERALMSKTIPLKIEAQGSPYVQDDFESVKISGFNNQNYEARFNAYSGDMEVKINDGSIIALDPKGNYEVTFKKDNKRYRPFTYVRSNKKEKRSYLVILYETEEFVFLKGEVVKFYDKVKANSSYQNEKPAKFQREDDEYYLFTDDKVTYFPTNKKELAKAFPKQANGIKSFVKSEKLSYKKEADLIKIAEFIIKN